LLVQVLTEREEKASLGASESASTPVFWSSRSAALDLENAWPPPTRYVGLRRPGPAGLVVLAALGGFPELLQSV